MIVISNSIDNKSYMTTTMFVNINIVLPAMYLYLAKKNVRFEVFWLQLHSLEYKYLLSNHLTKDTKSLAQ